MAKSTSNKFFGAKLAKKVVKDVSEAASSAANTITKIGDTVMYAAAAKKAAKDAITTNSDAVIKYFLGQGTPVKLTDVALIDDAMVKTALKTQITEVGQELLGRWLEADTPYVRTQENSDSNWVVKHAYDLTYSQMFFMGNGWLRAYLNSDGEKAQIHYYIRDAFTQPLKFDNMEISEVNLAPPYPINWDADSRWYSVADAKNAVGVIGIHEYSWQV